MTVPETIEARSPRHDPVLFRIDRRDDIVFVNDAWTRFALDNEAPELVADFVLGRSLWDFVADATTRQLYAAVLRRVRSGSSVRFPLRCDSPSVRRYLEMSVGPREGATVQFETRLVAAETRPHQVLWKRATPSSTDLLLVCGWCKRVNVSSEWLEVEDALVHLNAFDHPQTPPVTHGICPRCVDAVLSALRTDDASAGQ
jgi:hypothetical protein